MNKSFSRLNRINGELNLPGDKSISHRALIFSAMASGSSSIKNISAGEDIKSTISCLMQTGITISKNNDLTLIDGRGFKGFTEPSEPLYAGNSGTTARLLSGLYAAQDFPVKITGDESLSRRPMRRIIDPLKLMGADIWSENGTLPIKINPVNKLIPSDYKLIIPSAQVKSAIILAGLHLDEESRITEFIPSRDHTERMLGLEKTEELGKRLISVSRKNYPFSNDYFIPSDISSAVFFIIPALLIPGSELRIKNVSLNPGRIIIIDILRQMGAAIKIENVLESGNEPYGDLIVRSSILHNVEIPADLVPGIIDEIPALAIAGIFSEGDFSISGAEELRHKESDRIASVCSNLKNTGLIVEEYIDGFLLSGNIIDRHYSFDSFGDHRVAMAFAILSVLLKKGSDVSGFESVSISNPGFLSQLKSVSE